jgi:hypothetical protein
MIKKVKENKGKDCVYPSKNDMVCIIPLLMEKVTAFTHRFNIKLTTWR